MGLVDAHRNRRGSWEVLREEYSPVIIDSFRLSPKTADKRTATIALHTRGPVDVDMPVYTLHDYSLHWVITSPDGSTKFSEGDVSVPTLAPASQWSGEFEFNAPTQDYIIKLNIVRPTGYNVIERSYNKNSDVIP
jgi:hypothetical protein